MNFTKCLVLVLLSATSAMACFDPGAQLIDTQSVLKAYKNNASFERCTALLNKVGAKTSSTFVYRKNRDENSTDSVIYKLLFSGKDGKGQQFRLMLSYDLKYHGFTCERGVSYQIPRGGCF
jgi:hypothetical protein